MTATRVTALVLGGALLTSWLVVAGTDRQAPAAPPRPPAVAPPALPPALAAETARLRAFLDHTPAPREAGRNPFTFAPSRPADERRRERRDGDPPAAERAGDARAAGDRPDRDRDRRRHADRGLFDRRRGRAWRARAIAWANATAWPR